MNDHAEFAPDNRRLEERFAPGDAVEITFSGDVEERWFTGRVDGSAPPGLWVTLSGGARFFVTNTRRIRAQSHHEN
jgi:hypothetical protein